MVPQLEWGGRGYATYEVVLKVSGKEKQAENLTATEAQMLQGWMGTQFGEQQNWLNNIIMPQLKQMFTNPPGFGAQGLAAMRSQTIGTIGAQLSSQEKNLASQFATQNMAGLGSGVQMAETAGLQSQAAGQEAAGLQNIAIANAQAQMQQQQWAGGALMQGVQQLGQVPGSAALALQASGTQFNEAYKMAQQGGLLQNILGGIAGAGMGYLTGGPAGAVMGGISGLAGGGGGGGGADYSSVMANLPSWLGGPSAPTDQAWATFTPGQIGQPAYLGGPPLAPPPSPLAIPASGIGAYPS